MKPLGFKRLIHGKGKNMYGTRNVALIENRKSHWNMQDPNKISYVTPATLVLCTTFHLLANSTFIIAGLITLYEKMSALKWRMCNIPICEEKRVVWRFGISRMVCSCKMRVQQKVDLHCERGCSFQFLLASPHLTTYKVPDIVLATSFPRVLFVPVPKLCEIMLNFARFLFSETTSVAKTWNTSACQGVVVRLLRRYVRDTVSPWRKIWVYYSHNVHMQSLGSIRTGALAWL